MRFPFASVLFVGSIAATGLAAACSGPAPATDPHLTRDAGPGIDASPPDAGAPDATPAVDDAGPLGTVQMNDVSVLFPLPKTQEEFDAMITPASVGSAGPLLTQSLFEKATGIVAAPPLEDVLYYPTLRLVALRLDPCFGQIGPVTDPASCLNQLRLIFQPVSFDPSTSPSANVLDGAVHAFYSLTRPELVAAVRAIAELRTARRGTADLGPLAVHPVLAAEGLTGPTAQGLAALIAKYAGMGRLTRFTLFEVGDTDWRFSGYDVDAGVAQAMVIPTLPGAETGVEVNKMPAFSLSKIALQVSPITTAPDNVGVLLDANTAVTASPAAQKSAFESALRIENPNFHSPNTIDCASCHLAGPARTMVGEAILGLAPSGDVNDYLADGTFVPAADMLVTTSQDTAHGIFNLHAFSYVLSNPLINQRVINETAAVVAYLSAE